MDMIGRAAFTMGCAGGLNQISLCCTGHVGLRQCIGFCSPEPLSLTVIAVKKVSNFTVSLIKRKKTGYHAIKNPFQVGKGFLSEYICLGGTLKASCKLEVTPE